MVLAAQLLAGSCAPGGAPGPRAIDAEPLAASELAKLRGQWRGAEVETDTMWTFSFGDANLVMARSDDGEWYQGLAVFHTALGRQRDGTIRVPPGSGVLDVDVALASAPVFVGKTSLGTYYEMGPRERLLCASKPGVLVRAKSYEVSTQDLRCFQLRKIADKPALGLGERPLERAAPPR